MGSEDPYEVKLLMSRISRLTQAIRQLLPSPKLGKVHHVLIHMKITQAVDPFELCLMGLEHVRQAESLHCACQVEGGVGPESWKYNFEGISSVEPAHKARPGFQREAGLEGRDPANGKLARLPRHDEDKAELPSCVRNFNGCCVELTVVSCLEGSSDRESWNLN